MQRYLNLYRLTMKRKFKSPVFWIMATSMILLMFIIRSINIPTGGNCSVLIYSESDGEYAVKLVKGLTENRSVFSFKTAESRKELEEYVMTGDAECGIEIPADFDEKIKSGKTDGVLKLTDSMFSTKTDVVKETVCTELYRVYSEKILQDNSGIISGTQDSQMTGKILKLNQQYLENGKLFHTEYVNEKGEKSNVTKPEYSGNEMLRATVAIITFISILLSVSEGGESSQSYALLNIPLSMRKKYMLTICLAGATAPAVIGIAAILMTSHNARPVMEIVAWTVLIAVSVIWSLTFRIFFGKAETYMSRVAVITVACLVMSPLLWDYGQQIRAFKDTACIFPTGVYFKLISCIYTY